ncbi:major facilitator superfamily domain-containing protein [Aspergillus bertholletiae]|uniref:Major facilitator superfamily domain-containing protein n=1 Tax=Aspergillus bertholletiae TaxID=1226010 RepID=A0A5N7BPT5_9EURO|nr:major facilitator superfamily domain-containing protein [Aspergillus bertholletiae]
MLVLLYLIAYIDKTNIGNAKIEGLLPDLGMNGNQYNIALSIFFIPYVLAEVPSNIFLNRFKRLSMYLGSLIFVWGIIMTCTGFIRSFASLVGIRFLLGLFEAGFLPGAVLIISKWYLPHETQTRIAILYTSAASGGAFSGLLAFVIAKMDGIAGYEGWRWIFIIEGLATISLAVLTFFFLLDSPQLSSGWLTPDEIRFLEVRQVANSIQGSQHHGVPWGALVSVLTDWKIYLLILANWSNAVPNYALKFTMPQIIQSMGFTSAKAQLLTIPPYAVGAFSAYVFSIFADRYTWRMPFIIIPQLSQVAAFSILFTKASEISGNIALCYFGVCLACFGMYPILPGVNAWNVSNLPNPTKRAIGIGYLVCMGNAGGIIGSFIYQEKEAPRYPTGYGNSLAFASAGFLACIVLELCLFRLNKQKARLSEVEIRERYTDGELDEMGEKSPLFQYKL